MAEETVILPYQRFELNSNQVPQAAPTALVTPNVQTCDSEELINQSGPSAVGTSATPIPASDVVETPAGEPLYRRTSSGYVEIGFATEFVNFPHIQHGSNLKVVKEVAMYLRAMIDAATAEGVTVGIRSGFRTMEQQQYYWSFANSNPSAVAAFESGNLVDSRGGVRDSLGNAAASPGRSNHQNGIAFDFNTAASDGRVYAWMTKNAWKYGFIRAVRKERWHWEYWGNWAGQEKPEWAKHSGWGADGHQPKSMFQIVPRIHAQQITRRHYWSNKGASSPHTDAESGGVTNTWIGFGNEHLPDKFDREEPGWDTA
tara:strand:+ start:319 stop:1260 length:942 start_codon:yes stop_codon:yes gene_type:complete